MSTIAIIPARCGSKSIPFKNIKLFCGKPLIYWTAFSLQECDAIDQIIIATDCDEIKLLVSQFGFDKLITYDRSKASATDEASTESLLIECLNNNELAIEDDDTIVLVQATSPLTQTDHFYEALTQYKTQDIDSLLTCVQDKSFYWDSEGKPLNYDYKNRPRRQDFDGLFKENGAFYINKVKNIKKHKNRLSGKIGIYIMPDYTNVEIDEESDWIVAESLMKRYILPNLNDYPKTNIKLFITDVDGVLTDAGMYYTENGDEIKKFNTRDGMAFELLRKSGIKTAIITSEKTQIVSRRAKKLKIDFLVQDAAHEGKLKAAQKICNELNISMNEVAYIGDDINCFQLLSAVGYAACPCDAVPLINNIPSILKCSLKGGQGVVREFANLILTKLK